MKKVHKNKIFWNNKYINEKNLTSEIEKKKFLLNIFLHHFNRFLKNNNINLFNILGSEIFESSFFKSKKLLNFLKVFYFNKFLSKKYILEDKGKINFQGRLLINLKKNKFNRFILVLINIFEDKFKLFTLFFKLTLFKIFTPKNKINKKTNNGILFSSYLSQSNYFKTNNYFKSYQWKNVPHILRKNQAKNYLHIYPLNKETLTLFIKQKFIPSKKTTTDSSHFFFLNFISYNFILLLFLKSLFKYNYTKKTFLLDFYFSEIFSSQSYFESLFWNKIFKNFFNKYKLFKNCFYLFENQQWEKYFLYYYNFFVNKNIYAFNHSACREMDYRIYTSIFFSRKKNFKKFFPSKILINDNISLRNINSYDKSFKLIKVKSFENKLKIIKKKNKKALIIGDISLENTTKLIKVVNELKKNKIISDFIFKPHPSNQYYFVNKFKNINFFLKKIDEFKQKIHYVLCVNSTTAAIRFAEMNNDIFVYIPKESINLSPLKNYYNNIFFNDLLSLKKIIKLKRKNTRKNIYFRKLSNKSWLDLK